MYKGVFYHPWQDLRNLRKDIHRVVNDVLGNEPEWAGGYWQPPIDVVETEDSYLVAAELPGVNKEDVIINIHGNTLRLSGEKKLSSEKNHRLRSEFWQGPFRRSIDLPGEIDREKIVAKYENGILIVTLPKMEESRSNEIKIEVS